MKSDAIKMKSPTSHINLEALCGFPSHSEQKASSTQLLPLHERGCCSLPSLLFSTHSDSWFSSKTPGRTSLQNSVPHTASVHSPSAPAGVCWSVLSLRLFLPMRNCKTHLRNSILLYSSRALTTAWHTKSLLLVCLCHDNISCPKAMVCVCFVLCSTPWDQDSCHKTGTQILVE